MLGGLSVLLVASMLFSGCTSDLGASGIKSAKTESLPFAKYHWAPNQIADSFGNILGNHPLARDPSVPNYIYQLMPGAGPEPTLGITSKDTIFVVTLDKVLKSDDWGRSWQQVFDYASPGQPTTQDVFSSLDPLLYVDPATDYVFVSHLEPDPANAGLPWCQYLSYSKDNGKTWSDKPKGSDPTGRPGVNACMVGISDHQKLAAAKPGPKTSIAEKALFDATPDHYQNVLYYCHQKFNAIGDPRIIYTNIVDIPNYDPSKNPAWGSWCEASYDAGRSWHNPVQLSTLREGCPAGLVGQPGVFPDGTVAVPLGSFGNKCYLPPTVAVTEDSGATYTLRVMPNLTIGQVEIDPDIAVTPDGTAYMTFRGKDQHMYMVRSKDKFATWEGPFRVSPMDNTLNVFTAIVAGDNGRIAVHYLGTRDAQDREATPANATGGSFWHSFISWSFNSDTANPTWFTQQANPNEDPIQIGCVWLSGGGGGPKRCRNLLDFIDMAVSKDGRVVAVTTDGCTPRNGCTTDTDNAAFQSHDRESAVMVQDFGYSLYAEKGVLPRLGLVAPTPLPRT
jgi:hypothetical protein